VQRHLWQVRHGLERGQHLAQQREAPAVDVDAHEGRGEQVAVDELGRPVRHQQVVAG
jgi:hypothetical protein